MKKKRLNTSVKKKEKSKIMIVSVPISKCVYRIHCSLIDVHIVDINIFKKKYIYILMVVMSEDLIQSSKTTSRK